MKSNRKRLREVKNVWSGMTGKKSEPQNYEMNVWLVLEDEVAERKKVKKKGKKK